MAFAGDMAITDYSVDASVYVQVDELSATGPYQGLTARTNYLTGEYYYYCAEFDTDKRLRLFYLQMTGGMPVIRQLALWTEGDIPGGVPDEDGWFRMKIKLISDSIWAYWEGVELSGCPIIDSDATALVNGPFGVYAYIFSGECLTMADDIVVYEEPHGVSEGSFTVDYDRLSVSPNPFRSEVTFRADAWVSSTPDLEIYGPSGRLLLCLSPLTSRGTLQYVWDGRDCEGGCVPEGTYFYRLGDGTGGKIVRLR
jgi:hypothetical protein